MHEYAVTQGLLKIVSEAAREAGVSRILEIRLVIGDLSTIVDDSVAMYFDIMAKGTPAEGAKLVFRRVPAEFCCHGCGHVFEKPKTGYDCPVCGDYGTPTGKGREFYVESMEVDDSCSLPSSTTSD